MQDARSASSDRNVQGALPETGTVDHALEELELKREELALKREEFNTRLEYQKHEKRMSLSPLLVAAIAAIAGISGSVVGSMTQYISEARKFELEARKAQSEMVFEAIRTGDPDKAAENLQFLLETGLLVDPNGTIRKYLSNRRPTSGAKLPSKLEEPKSPAASMKNAS
jgi:hypothetical protein